MQSLKELINKKKIVSFDVYNTLIRRNVANDFDVFSLVEKEYARVYKTNIKFYRRRRIAEKIARRVFTHKEVNLEEIYRVLAVFYPKDICEALKKIEIDIEIQISTVNEEIKNIFDYAKENKKRIFIVSDMYLSEQIIKKILDKNGYSGYEKILVSSEYRQTKFSGELFDTLIANYDLKAEDIIHIGDNKRADYIMANSREITAFWYKPKSDFIRYTEPVFSKKLESYIIAAFIRNHLKSGKTYAYNIGYSVFGPLLFGYVKWLKQQCDTNSIKKVLFFSRDGYILQKCFKLLYPEIENHYIYISRKSIIKTVLQFDSTWEDRIHRYKSWPYELSIKNFLKKFGIDAKNNENNKEYVLKDFYSKDNLLKILEVYEPKIREESIRQADLFEQYILTSVAAEKKIAIVDLGGRRTIEKNLREFIAHKKLPIDIYGFYVEINGSETATSKGYLFSQNHNKNIKHIIPLFYYFLEVVLSAPHGSVEGYQFNQKVHPILEPYDYQIGAREHNILQDLHKGLLDFIVDFKEFGDTFFEITPDIAINNLINLGLYPDRKALDFWGHFHFNADELEQLIEKEYSCRDLIFDFKKVYLAYKKSMWKSGFIAHIIKDSRISGDVLQFLYILKGIKS